MFGAWLTYYLLDPVHPAKCLEHKRSSLSNMSKVKQLLNFRTNVFYSPFQSLINIYPLNSQAIEHSIIKIALGWVIY